MERRKMGQDILKSKRDREEQELKRIADEKKKEKLDDQIAKQRIMDRIQQDRYRRNKSKGRGGLLRIAKVIHFLMLHF